MRRIYLYFKHFFWLLLSGLLVDVEVLEAHLLEGQDCRRLDQGPFYFKRVDDYTYQCVKDGPLYQCPEHWSIPEWYTYDDKPPCMCQDVVNQGQRVCPQDPFHGLRTTQDPRSASPVLGTINDNGCPSPYHKYEDTLRIYNSTNAKEFKLTSNMGFLTPEDECKYHCLSVATCTGTTYSIQNGDPMCVGFFTTSKPYDYRGSDYHVYFEKIWCIFDRDPILPTPPPIQHGLLLQNTKQGSGGRSGKAFAFLKGVSELSCYSWCHYESSCAAVDFNKYTDECFYFTKTDCYSHEPALDHCCNHYKKKTLKCL